jgi:TraB/PrgY/gumN family
MKRIKAFLAATGIFLTFITAAQNAADTSFEKTVFWQVTGNGLADTSYLFGTIHPVFREDVHIAANMLQALLRSEMVFFEHQLYNIDDTVYLSLHSMEKPVLKRLLGGLCFRLLKEKLALYNDTITSSPYFLRLRPDYQAYGHSIGEWTTGEFSRFKKNGR